MWVFSISADWPGQPHSLHPLACKLFSQFMKLAITDLGQAAEADTLLY